jgi:hypothetical protein
MSGRQKKAERRPFARSNVKKAQPEFMSYLAELFGERECR